MNSAAVVEAYVLTKQTYSYSRRNCHINMTMRIKHGKHVKPALEQVRVNEAEVRKQGLFITPDYMTLDRHPLSDSSVNWINWSAASGDQLL